VITIVTIGRGCGLLNMLLAPLPATLGALPNILDGNVRRCIPAVALGWVKLGRLVTSSVLGGDAAQLLGGVPNDVCWFLEG
jgi:hypothetical protein